MAAAAAEAAYAQEALKKYECLPGSRSRPPTEESAGGGGVQVPTKAAYEQLVGPGVALPDGSVVFKPGDAGEVATVMPFVTNLMAEWLSVAVQGMTEAHVVDLLIHLTNLGEWISAKLISGEAPYCNERVALVQAVLDGMTQRGADISVFFQDTCAKSPRLMSVICGTAELPTNAPLFQFWLEASTRYASRAAGGRLDRKLHPTIFNDKRMAINAAITGNLVVLKALDSDGFDVREKVGGGCCGGGQEAIKEARKHGHKECADWLEELKSYPKPLKY